MVLFADAGETATVIGVATLAGAAVQWAAAQVWAWVRERKGEQAAKEKTIVDHQAAAIARLEDDAEERDKKVDHLQERVERSQERTASLIGHLRYLEALLRNARVEFVPWTDPSTGSGPHHPIPEGK